MSLPHFNLKRKNSERSKVLVIDDQPMFIRQIYEILQHECDLFMARDGNEVLDKCLELHPDLVLLDIVMPDVNGYDVCKQIKDDPTLTDIPIIFVTAHYDEKIEEKGFALGAVDFLKKPINPVVALARIRTQLKFKQQNDLLRAMALIDGLTGIPNRREFDEVIVTLCMQCARNKEPISILMIDVDFFKKYNDLYGHQLGDLCLQNVATCLNENVHRPTDLVARYGGEEFVCILPSTEAEGAVHIAQKLVAEIEGLAIEHADSSTAKNVTISIGCATINMPTPDCADKLIEHADKLLYEAKELGRNRVEHQIFDIY